MFWAKLASLVTGARREADLADEIQLHLDLLAADYRRQGLTDENARRAARRAFGGVLLAREASRRELRPAAFDALWRDIRYACRLLVRDRATSMTGIVLLTCGISSATLMADMVDRLMLRGPNGVSEPDRVARVYESVDGGTPDALITNYTTIDHLSGGLRYDLDAIAGSFVESASFGRGVAARRIQVVSCTQGYFDVLSLTPALGVLPGIHHPQVPDGIVISHALWKQDFGADPDVLRRPLRIGRRTYTIVAVAPLGFVGIDDEPADAWISFESRADDGLLEPDWRTSTTYMMLSVIARLRAETNRVQASAHASAVYRTGPLPYAGDVRPHRFDIVLGELPAARAPGGTGAVRLVGWLGAVSTLVMLVACGNVGNLLLLRGLRRRRELVMKAALGATRARLMRELFIEAAVLAALAGFLALVMVEAAGGLVARLLLPPVLTIVAPIDARVAAIAVAVSGMAVLVMGLIPAIKLSSSATMSPTRAYQAVRAQRLVDAFVGFQVALSVPLVVGAALFSLSMWRARQVDFGVDTTHVIMASMNAEDLASAPEVHDTHRRLAQLLKRLPQVADTALVSGVPYRSFIAVPFHVPGARVEHYEGPYVTAVDSSYFAVAGLRFVAGRPFTEAENAFSGRPVVIINQTLARLFWPDRPALGRCIEVRSRPCAEVVGIVSDAAMTLRFGPRRDTAAYYVPIEQYSSFTDSRTVLIRTKGPSSDVLAQVRAEALAIGPNLPYIDVIAVDDLLQPALRPFRRGATIFMGFGALALTIASIGLAVVTSYSVAQRQKELGIRLVLGANPSQLIRHVLLRTLMTAGAGLCAGCLLAYLAGRWLQSLLFEVAADDLRIHAAIAAVFVTVSLIAAGLPARRAGQLDPMDSLRSE
jgi:predicted permease